MENFRDLIGQAADPQRWSTSWGPVIWSAIALALMTGLILWVYRSMQKPRLYLTYTAPGSEPTATWQSLIRYLVLIPIMLGIWMMSLMLILTVAAEDRSAEEIALASAAVIGAVRILAHITPEGSHELGKTVPLAVLSIILLGAYADPSSWDERLTDLDRNADAIDYQYVTLLVLDLVVTALWYWRVRATWREERPNSSYKRLTRWMRPGLDVFRAVRDFGKTKESKAKPHGEMTAHGG
ncbi:MAG: hypothetical protein WC054_05445 [Candidatus Nanopelagicales bacterium]